MSSRRLDFNPAGGYLKELRARGLVRSSSPEAPVEATLSSDGSRLPLGKVLRAASAERRPLGDVQQEAGVDATDFIAAVHSLSNRDLVRIAESEQGLDVQLTPDGEATLEG